MISTLVLSSCEDFTGKNLESAVPPKNGASQIDLLIAQTDRINQGAFTSEKLIANTGFFVVQPLIDMLAGNINGLSESINQHCTFLSIADSIDKDQLEKLREPIRKKWKKATLTYHKLEMMNFGPTKKPTSTVLDSLYSFDGEKKCRVDLSLLQLSLRNRFPRTDIISNYNVRGLDALEPLFFADPDVSRCNRVSPRLQVWFEKTLIERERDVCRYAKHLMKDMTTKVNDLEKEWNARGSNFPAKLLRGALGTTMETINTISQSLFYLDTDVKDKRVAYPAGYDVRIDEVLTKCPTSTCPDNIETPYATMTLEVLLASLEGFQFLFNGINPETMKDGYGIDDLLTERGHSELASNMRDTIQRAVTNVKAISKTETMGSLLAKYDKELCDQTTTTDRKVEICALVEDIRGITSLLKNEYLLALQEFRAPRQAQGDND